MDMKPPPAATEVTTLKKYTGAAERIMKFLAMGISQVQVAKAVGCHESFVSQLLAEEDFQVQVGLLVEKDMERARTIDENYEETEKILSEKLKTISGFMLTPDSILKTLKFVNDAKRKTQQAQPIGGAGANIHIDRSVKLLLPSVVINRFTVNPNNEIIGVEDQELVTLNSKSMDALLIQKRVKALTAPKLLPDSELTSHGHGKQTNASSDPWSDL